MKTGKRVKIILMAICAFLAVFVFGFILGNNIAASLGLEWYGIDYNTLVSIVGMSTVATKYTLIFGFTCTFCFIGLYFWVVGIKK